LFFTNNSSKTAEFYIKKLGSMGCEVTLEDILTSGDVTIEYLNSCHKGESVFLLGTELLRGSFLSGGIRLDSKAPQIVVVGFDTTLSYEGVSRACSLIRSGALFIATHPDLNCPTEDGFIPDCGSMCAMITASTGVAPKYLGKPYQETIDAIMHVTGYQKEEIAFVGDRLYTDIAIGARNGVTSVLVLSGETAMADVAESPIKPDFIFPSLLELSSVL
jgi:HAD superfamily hydrolase (TIGR01450 family)